MIRSEEIKKYHRDWMRAYRLGFKKLSIKIKKVKKHKKQYIDFIMEDEIRHNKKIPKSYAAYLKKAKLSPPKPC